MHGLWAASPHCSGQALLGIEGVREVSLHEYLKSPRDTWATCPFLASFEPIPPQWTFDPDAIMFGDLDEATIQRLIQDWSVRLNSPVQRQTYNQAFK